MVRMDMFLLLWLSEWKCRARNASCIAWDRNLPDEVRGVNPLASSGVVLEPVAGRRRGEYAYARF
jgi:hypothetical protein